MYAKVSQIEFQPEGEEEGLQYIRTRMFPSARVQEGFKDAYILRDVREPQRYTLISLWESRETMDASRLPEGMEGEQGRFERLVTSFSQEIKEVDFLFSERFRA